MSLTIYLTADQVEQHLAKMRIPCRFTDSEKAHLTTTPVVSGEHRVLVFPTPADNTALNLSFIKSCVGIDPRQLPAFFDHPWYQEEAFMKTCCRPGWHLLHTDVLPESIGQPRDYARSLAARGFFLPAAVEVVLMLFLHYVESGEQLLFRKHTWCEDTASMNRSVTVGAFGKNGVFVSGHPESFASRGLGICPKLSGV